jgi:hypothetical protein
MDALCYDDLDAFGRELDDPLEELRQDLYHRIIEDPGSNIDDPARGFGLEGWLSRGLPRGTIVAALRHGLEAELLKDDRVAKVSANVTETAPDEYLIEIEVIADETVLGIKLVADGAGVRRVE